MNRINKEEALSLFKEGSFHDIGYMADEVRKRLHPENTVTFIIDRNINYTNICINKCKFCAFYRDEDSKDAYTLTDDEIFDKIDETIRLGGTQILLQGGINPKLDLDYFCRLFKEIKQRFDINIHGLSPTEIMYLAQRHSISVNDTLKTLNASGLDSIPGGGAEILSDRVRDVISPKKIKTSQWLEVMESAHKIGMKTTATMMFGSIETAEEIIMHLELIRDLQDRTGGFTAFIPWSFQPSFTRLSKEMDIQPATAVEYLRLLAISRIFLDNIKNIQASWVTQGIKIAQVALFFGANDMGSTMLEENVVRSAGVSYRVTMQEIIDAIKDAGFIPVQRDTYYNHIRRYE
ncbi:MAG: dehypoxanthine futalosine cyclase [Thermodesulfovibrionales bacterium]|nr:dehypoxanthine futalosine cyclase [Thermodesulfovibrionales bacterium]